MKTKMIAIKDAAKWIARTVATEGFLAAGAVMFLATKAHAGGGSPEVVIGNLFFGGVFGAAVGGLVGVVAEIRTGDPEDDDGPMEAGTKGAALGFAVGALGGALFTLNM